jgi:hypothetical protein
MRSRKNNTFWLKREYPMQTLNYQAFMNTPSDALFSSHQEPVLISNGDEVTHVVLTAEEYAKLQQSSESAAE